MNTRRPTLLFVTSQNTAVSLQIVRTLLASGVRSHVHVLFEQPVRTVGQRARAQWRHLRRNGLIWVPYRIAAFAGEMFRKSDNSGPTLLDALDDLHRSFPGRFTARVVPNLHHPAILNDLREAAPDLGIVFGTRILRAELFTIPRLGMVNIHQGRLPDYRGMPPGFWELYNGEQSAGVTLHKVAAGLDTGEILCQDSIDIRADETLDSLQSRLESAVLERIGGWIELVVSGQVRPQPQRRGDRTYRAPTVYERLELRRRLRRRRKTRHAR